MRTITISEEQGIKAVICRPPGSDSTVTQSFLFAKAKGWTLAKAKEWFASHDKTSGAAPIQYDVRAEAVERDRRKFVAIDIIDESTSRGGHPKKWRINPAGKARALARLMGTPLIGPPEEGHEARRIVGAAVDFESNRVTRALFDVPLEADWRRADSGEWGPVSPQLTPIQAHWEEDTFVLDDWSWDHIAFVPKGAFSNMGVRSTCVGDPTLCGFTAENPYGFSRAVSAALDSSWSSLGWQDVGAYSPETGKQGSREKTGGPPGGVTMEKDNECEEKIAELTETKDKLETEVKDLKAQAADLTETNKKLDGELKELKEVKAKAEAPPSPSEEMITVQAELKTLKAENDSLKAWKQAQEDADHMRRVQDALDLRVAAGLLDAKSVQAAAESIKKLPNDALDQMKADLQAVKGKFDSLPSGPKARLIPTVGARFDPMQATVGDLVGKKPGEA